MRNLFVILSLVVQYDGRLDNKRGRIVEGDIGSGVDERLSTSHVASRGCAGYWVKASHRLGTRCVVK